LSRKQKAWNAGDKVIFNDLGNWGMGTVDSEGEESESSRWYWINVEEMVIASPKKDKRLVRADDLCKYDQENWKAISSSLLRIQEIRNESVELEKKIRKIFDSDFVVEDEF